LIATIDFTATSELALERGRSSTVTVEVQGENRDVLLRFADVVAKAAGVTSVSLQSLGEREALLLIEVTQSQTPNGPGV
jgi:hypothetical protein